MGDFKPFPGLQASIMRGGSMQLKQYKTVDLYNEVKVKVEVKVETP